MFVYLDNSATTKPYQEVVDGLVQYMEQDYGNPSSLHRMGINSEKGIKQARRTIAQTLSVKEEEILFTSGGTESDNMAIFGGAGWAKRRGNKIITTAVEHPAVLESCKKLESSGFKVEYIGVDGGGQVNIRELEEALDDDTILISLMHVNNEVGTIQPLRQVNNIRKKYEKELGREILFHTDAVQSYGKLKLDVKSLDLDLISISGHKIHGPKGIGALYIRKGLSIPPYIYGGGQEGNMRSGTENVPAITGFGIAADIIHKGLDDNGKKIRGVKDYLLAGIESEIRDIRINGDKEGIPSILNVSFLGVRGEVILHTLEQFNIYVATGSACSSNKKGKSHVLKAMGLSDREIEGAIRFSFNQFNSIEEMDYVLLHLKAAVAKFRKLGSFR